MNIDVIEKRVLSADNVHNLYGKVYLPSGEVKGYFHVVHGMTEHIGRYDEFLREMARSGYIAFAFDNLGHGKTVNDKSELGYIAKKHGYDLLAKDLAVFYNSVKESYGDYPYYIMGHSMGSFIVRYALGRTIFPNKAIIMGIAGRNNLASLGLLVIDILKLIKGEKHVSKFLDKVAFGSYNKKFSSENSRRSWLTTDESVRKRYDNDEFCSYRFTLSAMRDLITLNKLTCKSSWYKNFSKTLPVLIVSGKDDPVGKYGKGVEEVYNNLIKNGCNAQVRIYQGARHEILSEPLCKNAVLEDILSFISK